MTKKLAYNTRQHAWWYHWPARLLPD